MSASSMPTFRPRSRRPSARLTAVVDLPTPPLPEATAITALTPGMPGGFRSTGCACACGDATRDAGPAAPAARSAVKATSTDFTPAIARTASSALLRTGSHAFTSAASTVREKNTLPSVTTMSDRTRASVSGVPLGDSTSASVPRTCSLPTAIVAISFACAYLRRHHKRKVGTVNADRPQQRLTACVPIAEIGRRRDLPRLDPELVREDLRWRRWRFWVWALWDTPWQGTLRKKAGMTA